MKKSVIVCVVFLLLISLVFAHGDEEESKKSLDISTISFIIIGISSANALFILALSCFYRKQKALLFWILITPIIFTSIFLIVTTLLTNFNADSQGPVHWHADYEIWICEEKINLVDPQGFSNKVGTNLFHEHNDDRIHIEGVVTSMEEVNLQHFIETVGGEITKSGITLITNDGLVSYENGEKCNGTLQVFVYKTENEMQTQEKLDDFLEYVPSPYSEVPPGDCIIIEFGEEKESTEKMCTTYRGENHGR